MDGFLHVGIAKSDYGQALKVNGKWALDKIAQTQLEKKTTYLFPFANPCENAMVPY